MPIGLLDSKASTKGTGNSVVAAADCADVSSRGTNAVELLWHLDVDLEVLLLGLAQAKGSRDVVGHLQWSKSRDGVAGLVHVALKGTGTIGVDLVDCDLHNGACLDLGHAASSELVLGLFANVDVSIDLSTTAGVDDVGGDLVVSDNCGILLAGVDGGAITSNFRVDFSWH